MSHRKTRKPPRDRGAAAVEFALLLPMLLLLIFGIIDFGRALNAQITLTQAAREGARLDALGKTNVVSSTQAAATGLAGVGVTQGYICQPNDGGKVVTPPLNAIVKASYTFKFITPVAGIAHMFGGNFGPNIVLTATGVMPCET